MGGRGGSAVGVVVVAPGTSSSVGRVLGNRYVEVQFFRLQKLNRKIAYCCIRRCSLVLSASSAVSAFHFPFDDIYRRLLFFTLGPSVSA